MNRWQRGTRSAIRGWLWPGGRGGLSRREAVLLGGLAFLLLVWGVVTLLDVVVFEPRRALTAALTDAAEQLQRQEILMSRAETILARYRALETPGSDAPDSTMTETDVLRELSSLAGNGVHVRSVVPRSGWEGTESAVVIALDCEGPLPGIADYIAKILARMPGEVGNLSLAPSAAGNGDVVCRMSVKVVGLGV